MVQYCEHREFVDRSSGFPQGLYLTLLRRICRNRQDMDERSGCGVACLFRPGLGCVEMLHCLDLQNLSDLIFCRGYDR